MFLDASFLLSNRGQQKSQLFVVVLSPSQNQSVLEAWNLKPLYTVLWNNTPETIHPKATAEPCACSHGTTGHRKVWFVPELCWPRA